MKSRTRGACGRVLWAVASAALIQGGLSLALPRMPWLADPSYGNNLARLRHRLGEAEKPPLVVACFGSSRTYYGLDGARASQVLTEEAGRPVVVHNFGRPGGGTVTSLLYMRRLLADGIRPDLVVFEVIPIYFGQPDPLTEVGSSFHPLLSLRHDELAVLRRYSAGERKESSLRWWKNRLLVGSSHRRGMLLRIAPRLLTFDERFLLTYATTESGWMPLHGACKELTQTATIRQTLSDWLTPQTRKLYRNGPAANALREALAVCRDHGIPAALVLMPEGPLMRSLYPPRFWAEFIATVQEISQDGGAPIINARLWSDRAEFADSHHLLATGANRFSERLAREALSSLLSRTPSGDKLPIHSVSRSPGP